MSFMRVGLLPEHVNADRRFQRRDTLVEKFSATLSGHRKYHLNLLHDFEEALERRLGGVKLAPRIAPVGFQRERLLVAVLE